MAEHMNAREFLGLGDSLRERAARDRVPVYSVVGEMELSDQVAHKAHWLAGKYSEGDRRKLGHEVLSGLTPMHLEVVATQPVAGRDELLRRAAAADLTARQLRELARSERETDIEDGGGTIAALERSTRALEQYARFDDRALRTLIHGPNGDQVRRAATAGHTLADRLTSVS